MTALDNAFVLSTSGHSLTLVNPPGLDRRSRWPDCAAWLSERSGDLKPAPRTLGSQRHKATAKAPGMHVHAN